MPRKWKEILFRTIPPCDFCTMKGYQPVKPGIYDAPTLHGPWANLCTTHMRENVRKDCSIGFKRIQVKDG